MESTIALRRLLVLPLLGLLAAGCAVLSPSATLPGGAGKAASDMPLAEFQQARAKSARPPAPPAGVQPSDIVQVKAQADPQSLPDLPPAKSQKAEQAAQQSKSGNGPQMLPDLQKPQAKLGGPVSAQPAPWTLESLLALASASNPTLTAAQARTAAARGQLLQAGLYPNPRLGWVGSQILSNKNAGGEEGPLLSQEIVTAHKLQLAEIAAQHGVAAADFQAVTRWFDVATRVRMAYFEVLAAHAEVTTSEELEKLAKDGLDAATALQKGGAGTRPDVLQAQVEMNQVQLRREVAKQREAAAWRLLSVAVGVQELPAAPMVDLLKSPLPDLQWDTVLATTLSRSSEVQEAQAIVRQAEGLLQRARVEHIPNVTVGVRPFYSFPDQDKRLGVEVGMPIPVFNRNQGNVQSAEADALRTREEARLVELKLEERLAAAFQRYRTARKQTEAYEREILRDATESLKLVQLAYKRGDAKYDYAALLQAQRTVAQAQLAYVQALGEVWKAAAEIAGLAQD